MLSGTEVNVCDFITSQSNHAIFVNGYPNDFDGNVWDWLKERAILVRMYLNNGGNDWAQKSGWLGIDNHCDWEGVACTAASSVASVNLQNNQLSGPFPSDLNNLGNLQTLNIYANGLSGEIP
eukprot:CAMPEP_0197823512 /NCGR_PEP_ID=MMETSP1437-20131217/862_1 /TAXON_ID=49252 ORGANISM="Eucampia antarctica, Strain CCMP1452" /NCGR_SAMPLE_ID=MMETSP1437 /ASSEMBLY_ACC=CAM_ASM_001096 /LENGTH=121 /DNA_ID=CAMNT_0043422731 /DNA_START=84 /DNA_END=445 /DNA_ORIENTATION=-